MSPFFPRGPRGYIPRPKREHRINEEIRVREVRVIDESGGQVGVLATDQARQLARDRGVDLVEIAPDASPPVCKMLDYGRFLYEQKKKQRKAKKKQHAQEIKEVWLRPLTDKHDVLTKVAHAREWLLDGDKVVFTVRFRGREMAHKDIGQQVLGTIKRELVDYIKIERDVRMEGNRMSMTLMPKPGLKPPAKPQDKAGSKEQEGEPHAQTQDQQGG